VIDMGQTGTRLNLEGKPNGAAGSIQFRIDGQPVRTESAAPYTIGGDAGTDYLDWTPPLGTHTLDVVQYAGANGTGAVLGTTTLSFTAVAPQVPPPPPASTTVSARAVADAYGLNGATANTNYGNSAELQSGSAPSPGTPARRSSGSTCRRSRRRTRSRPPGSGCTAGCRRPGARTSGCSR
jgi:hypothetical protein